MFNRRLIFKILGTLLWVEAAFMSLCLILAVYHMESDIMAFALTIGITCLTGLVFRLLGRKATSALSRRDAYLLVTVVWIAFTAFGMLPFLIGGYIQHVTDAFFETMSGLTTTGATVIDKVEGLPHGILFWRSLTQWIGGLGIVFFTIAIIPSFVGGTVKVFAAEATGPIKSKMHPRLTTTAKALWGVYLLLTVACATCFFIFGMDLFDAANYAMTITATGGFATHDASTGYFNNPAIDYTAIVFMFLSGISFAMLYAALFKGKIKQLLKNAEFRLYAMLALVSTALIVYFLLKYNHYSVSDAIRVALFQVVSFLTTTGMFNEDAAHRQGERLDGPYSGTDYTHGLFPRLYPPVFHRLLHHDSCWRGQHQLLYHRPELRQQCGPHPGPRNRPDDVLEHSAHDGQVDTVGPDAHGTSGDFYYAGHFHSLVLEEPLTLRPGHKIARQPLAHPST